jgi:hypothetical protein
VITRRKILPVRHRDRHRRKIATERTRRYRERLRCEVIVVPVPVTNEIVGFLIDMHWLTEAVSENRTEIGRAIGAVLADSARQASRR